MTTTIRARLRAAIFSGAVGLLPSVALADGASNPKGAEAPEGIPDHAQAEARSMTDTPPKGDETTVPDHAQAEARSAADTPPTGNETMVPDHAQAERQSKGGDAE